MRFYLNYLAKEVALPGENPPIGILLCAGKDESTLQFAAGADQSIMVSRYVLELPKGVQLKQWLHEAREATEAQLRQKAPGEHRPTPKKPRRKPVVADRRLASSHCRSWYSSPPGPPAA